MRLLLDTHILVWWLTDSRQLPKQARALIAGREHVVFVSAASVWVLRIKAALKKVTLPLDFGQVLEARPWRSRIPMPTRFASCLCITENPSIGC
jgi:PIN domain nuclease of toxin-antitoxin system